MGMNYHGPMAHFLRILAVLLPGIAAASPALAASQAAVKRPAASAPATALSPALLDATLFYEILIGELATREGDMASGYALLLEAARRSGDERLYRRATDVALQARAGEQALAAAQAWQQAWPGSREASRYTLQILVALNRVDDIAVPLRAMLDQTPAADKPALLLAIAQLLRGVSDKQQAARMLQSALDAELRSADTAAAAWTAIGRMRLLAQDAPGGLEAARQAQAQDARSDGPALLALELMENGQLQAEELLGPYLQAQPNPDLRMAYARLLLEQQRYAEARTQLQAVTREKPDMPQAWLAQAALQVQEDALDDAERSLAQLTRLAQQNPDSEAGRALLTQSYLLHSQVAEKRADFAAADQWLRRIDTDKDLPAAQIRRASLLARQGKLKEARALLHSLPADTEEARRMNLRAEVQLLRDARAWREAYALQEKLVAAQPDDDDLEYELAMLAEKIGKHDFMEQLLRKVIARNPSYQHALNALGYTLADRGVHLDEAKRLIGQALGLAPNDPFITDSLGWVEFRLGNLQEARRLLEKAYGMRPDVEIAAHLGEVLWVLGEQERARTIWKEGARFNADNEVLRATLKRLGVQP